MVRRVHDLPPAALPATAPLPRPDDFPWWDFERLLDETSNLIDAAARRGLEAAIVRHGQWRRFTERVVCHGDVHPGNVMMTDGGPVLIDWDLLCWAPPGWDHGPMMTWRSRWGGNAGEYDAYAMGYGRSLVGDPAAEAYAELRLVAATLMRVRAGMRDPAAMPEAQARLRYWRGDPDAPAWRAQ
jgi:aminoglycoside phosphotransferase (APT) family kinase protein